MLKTIIVLIVTLLSAGLLLVGCGTTKGYSGEEINATQVKDVQRQIKDQIAAYMRFARKQRIDSVAKSDNGDICKRGQVDYMIDSIKLDLKTTLNKKKDASAETVVAASFYGASITPSANASGESENSQNVVFFEYPIPDGYYPKIYDGNYFNKEDDEINSYEIFSTLVAIHNGLTAASSRAPCLTSINYLKSSDKDNSNTIIIGLKITEIKGGRLSIGVGPIKLGGGVTRNVVNDNTLTLRFHQFDLADLPPVDSSKGVASGNIITYGNIRVVSGSGGLTDELFGSDDNKVKKNKQETKKPAAKNVKESIDSKTVSAQTNLVAAGISLCRDSSYLLYWCVDKDRKVELNGGSQSR